MFQGPCHPRRQVGAPTGLPSERTEGEIQAQTRGAVYDTAEPGGGHASGGFYEWECDPMERFDPQSGEKQSQRAATQGSSEHAAHY